MSDPIADAIAQAQAAAAASVSTSPSPSPASVPATVAPQGGAVAPARPISNSLADFASGGLNVEAWVKVTPFGLLIPKEADEPVKEAIVKIDLSECVRYFAIKASKGQIVKYWRTYDGITDTDGKPWAQAQLEAQQLDPKAQPYETVDLPMTLLEKSGTAEAGTTLGYSLSTTNKKDFANFLRQVHKAGLDVNTAIVQVKIGAKKMQNTSYTWGVMTFELVGSIDEQ